MVTDSFPNAGISVRLGGGMLLFISSPEYGWFGSVAKSQGKTSRGKEHYDVSGVAGVGFTCKQRKLSYFQKVRQSVEPRYFTLQDNRIWG